MPVEINEPFSIRVDIRDLSSSMKLEDIAWKVKMLILAPELVQLIFINQFSFNFKYINCK